MTKVYPFGSKPEDGENVEEKPVVKKATVAGENKVPSDVDEAAWKEAEKVWEDHNGAHGVDNETREAQVRDYYDQIAASNEQARKWEGK